MPDRRPPTTEKRNGKINFHSLYTADVVATGLFAVEGSTAAALANLDAFGIVVVGMITALAGGVLRDMLLGSLPPDALRGKVHLLTALIGGLLVMLFDATNANFPIASLWALDAAGLALFAATGAEKALRHNANGVAVVVLATVTGTGGGMLRDVLLTRTPAVLTQDIYASAAAAAGLLFCLCRRFGVPWTVSLSVAAVGAFVLRCGAVLLNWQLPHFAG